MGMNVKTWGPLAAAIVLGGIAAKTGFDIVSHRPAEKVVVQNMSKVVVAKDDIAPGTSLQADNLTVSTLAEGTAPAGTFETPDRLLNRVTTVALRKGQPVVDTALAPEGTTRGLTAIVPEGMRAVTMEINEVSGVAGLIVPGCHVDVVSTFAGDDGQMMTKTICHALEVVAVGRNFSDAPPQSSAVSTAFHADPNDPPLARSVTLLVTPKEAEVLDLAAHTGAPRLVLRSGRDSTSDAGASASDGVTVAELRQSSKPLNRWLTALTNVFKSAAAVPATPVAQAPATPPTLAQPVSDDRKLSDPLNLFGQPTTQPSRTRTVTIIRATKEETVQVPIEQKPTAAKPVLVNTDTTEAIPGAGGAANGGAKHGD